MDDLEYRAWWQLHLRASRGEPLSSQEMAEYEAGLSRFHGDEHIRVNTQEIAALDTQIAEAKTRNAELIRQRRLLEKRVADLQAVRLARQPDDALRK
ncbi:MAG TPA: hypothetical protein VKT77_17330 [Chthonomonadaceae bacterium]|nr:hypothetical protein [Chthonomonadaceae bacterium]